jgi:GGDEF domain-containing protein
MTQSKSQSQSNVERREGKNIAMLMLNLGDIEAISNNFDAENEQLLRQVQYCIRKRLRNSDSVAKLDNKNFVVLLERIRSLENAKNLANALVQNLSQSINPTLEHENKLDLSVQIDFVHKE